MMRPSFLALGDSYTIGEAVDPLVCWPAQLAVRLRDEGIGIGDPVVVAATGWTARELSSAMDRAAFEPPYALVTLLVGVNDQYRGGKPGRYGKTFRALLERALALAGGRAARVVAVSIPDWGVTPFAHREGRDAGRIARDIDAFNRTARGEAGSLDVCWVDITAVSRAPGIRSLLAADGLHPSGVQYARWVDAILPAARYALQKHGR